jgi:hypothetical protein
VDWLGIHQQPKAILVELEVVLAGEWMRRSSTLAGNFEGMQPISLTVTSPFSCDT